MHYSVELQPTKETLAKKKQQQQQKKKPKLSHLQNTQLNLLKVTFLAI